MNDAVTSLGTVDYVRIEFADVSGILRGRTVTRSYAESILGTGLNFAPANVLLDVADGLSDERFGPNAGDIWAVPDPTSFTVLPYLPRTGHMFADLVEETGLQWPRCSRSALKAMWRRVEHEFGEVQIGMEPEGHLATAEGGRLQRVWRLRQMGSDGADRAFDFLTTVGDYLAATGVEFEKFTVESGDGLFEFNSKQQDPVCAADSYLRFKQMFRTVAHQHGYVGTFMPKPWADSPGAGLHVHMSFRDRGGRDPLSDANDSRGLGISTLGYAYLGGLIKNASTLVLFSAPSVNSYKRLVPGSWAPTHACYGVGNRSAMVRVVQTRQEADSDRRQMRFEFRAADGTCNPYLLLTMLLAAGLDGIASGADPGDPVQEDLALLSEEDLAGRGVKRLPRSLVDALRVLEEPSTLLSAIGDDLVEAFRRVEEEESQRFNTAVTDWEHVHYGLTY